MVAIFRSDDVFLLGNLIFVVLVSAATRFGTTTGEDILTSGGNGMNQSYSFRPRNMEEGDLTPKLRRYKQSEKEDLTTAPQSAQRTSTAKSYYAEVTNSQLQNTQNEHNETFHDYSKHLIPTLRDNEKIVNRTMKPESVVKTKVEDFNKQANKNEDKDVYEDTELNAETSVESSVHQDKVDRPSSLSDISGLFPDISEDHIYSDILEDDRALDSYTTVNYDEIETPAENLQEKKNQKFGTEDTAIVQDNPYLSTTATQDRLSLDSISSASDLISKLPSSRLTTTEDVMYIDLELDHYTHVTRPRQFSYHTKYSFSKTDVYHWSTSSRHSSITDGNDLLSKPSNAITDTASISSTGVNVPSYPYTQTSLALPKSVDDRNAVYSSSIKNGKSITDQLSQNHESHSRIKSSFDIDSTSSGATNTLQDTSQVFLTTEIDEISHIIEKMNSTDNNYMYQLLHPLKTSEISSSSQNMDESMDGPSKSVNYAEISTSQQGDGSSAPSNFQTADVINTSNRLPVGSVNPITQEFTNNKETLLLTSFYEPTSVQPQASSLDTILESELISSDDTNITASGYPEASAVNPNPSIEGTEAVNVEVLTSKETEQKVFGTETISLPQGSELITPITVTTSNYYLTPSFELVATESTSHSIQITVSLEQDLNTPNMTSSDYPEQKLSSIAPTLVTSKPDNDFTTTDVPVIPSKPCDWPIPTVSPTENTEEENEEDMNEMKLPTYIYMHLSHAWPDFCNKQQHIKNRFSHICSQESDRKVEPRQIMFAGIKPCNRSRIQHHRRGVRIYVYTVDTEGNYSENLTKELETKLQRLQRKRLSAERESEVEICEIAIYRVPARPTSRMPDEVSSKMSSSGMIAAISISAIAGICLILMFTMLLILKQRQDKDHNSASSSDSYSMNSFAARGGSGRRKRPRLSIRSFLNQAFDEPEIPNHPLNLNNLSSVLQNKSELEDEFKNIPMDVPRSDTLPQGAEVKNRYANVIPVPETRVPLSTNSEQPGYINANFVKGYGGKSKIYIACQAPLEETIEDFWRMVWEQQSRVVIMLTHLEENGVSRCAPYFPENTVDCHRLYGDFQVTLLEKDVRENFVKSSLRLHDLEKNLFRDVAHVWYTAWPPQGVPEDAGSFMGCILELRTLSLRNSGPIVVHCSPGTGRTGTYIATDICMHEYQESRCVDILRCVARLRQDRSGAVQTFNQYLFIHEVLHEYALKLGTQSHRPSLMSLVSLKLSHQER